jgi:hypothetical protein
MYQRLVAISAFLLLFPLTSVAGQLTITPTTTLTAQTTNNTSTASTFTTQSNGNIGPRNISKIDVHSLLYPGASTKVFAHLMLWWGKPSHINIGYNSTDPVQVHRQVTDMISRGIDGIVMVWYGPNNFIDKAAYAVMKEAETHPGFTFALMIDHGAILWDSCSGCNPQQALLAQLQYIEQTYFPSPAYLRIGGRPFVTNFDIDHFYTIDWNALSAALPSNPHFVFQNSPAFTHPVTSGGYSWVKAQTTDYGMSYLSSFYKTGISHPALETLGASYKGFNDTIASWSLNRIMGQQCGQTWLQTFGKINSLYNAGNQLPYMQLVTWNDYEEGTEIESGVDNCVSLSSSVSSNSLQWKITGNESTIDHYRVYVSTDGQNLMPLIDQPAGYHSVNMCSYSLAPATYTLYVQAVGRPMMVNHMSSAVRYTPQCGTTWNPTPTPSLKLAASPSSLLATSAQPGATTITVSPQSGSFNQLVALSCSNLPAGMACSFSPAAVTPGGTSASSVLTLSVASSTTAPKTPISRPNKLRYSSGFLALSMMGIFIGGFDKKKIKKMMWFAVIGGAFLLMSAFGGRSARAATTTFTSQRTYQIVITGTSGSVKASTVATVTVK